MRKSTTVSSLTLVVLLLLSLIATGSAWKGRMVGGRTEVKDVKSNKEIQELGRFSVEQYNNNLEEDVSHFRLQQLHGAGRELKFVEVVKAETQVVSGIKYYLTVEVKEKESGDAAVKEEKTRVFEAQVVVQPWLQSKKLLKFAPSHK